MVNIKAGSSHVSYTSRVPSPVVLAVLNEGLAIPAVFKLPEQSPTWLLRQLPQICVYTHFSRFTSCLLDPYNCNYHLNSLRYNEPNILQLSVPLSNQDQ